LDALLFFAAGQRLDEGQDRSKGRFNKVPLAVQQRPSTPEARLMDE
jgi:hypothetical protein